MRYLLSVPRGLASHFHSLEEKSPSQWFVDSDPMPLGSGGGTVYLLHRCWQEHGSGTDFDSWLNSERKIVIHAGGKSRRLPAYATTGKILTPIPVFRWKRGQKIDQKLIDIQLPFYRRILQKAPRGLNTLVASGDILILNDEDPISIPEADVVVFGTWTEASQASRHGVFFCRRDNPGELAFMMQKPSPERIQEMTGDYYFLMDAGIWLLGSRAMNLLMNECSWEGSSRKFDTPGNIPSHYDLYGEFGKFIGNEAMPGHAGKRGLSTAIVPLRAGSFYHYGTTAELAGSTFMIQNKVTDQREIWHRRIKPHPDIFIMNSMHKGSLDSSNKNLWIENSFIPEKWKFSSGHVFTGIPRNDWNLEIPAGICLDMVPVEKDKWCIRPYGLEDDFAGTASGETTLWLNRPFHQWLRERGLTFDEAGIDPGTDIHEAPLFPVIAKPDDCERLIEWMTGSSHDKISCRDEWVMAQRYSSLQILDMANLERSYSSRRELLRSVLPAIAANYKQSVFYQLDLDRLADFYTREALTPPSKIIEDQDTLNIIHNRMLLSVISRKRGEEWEALEKEAFNLLREEMIRYSGDMKQRPVRSTLDDQIVWARSPVRLDLAGGWSDTPPYCIINGGRVMNLAVELNGQPPIQVYVTPAADNRIRIKSIDLGLELTIDEYADLEDYSRIGSGFAIARVALILSGFNAKAGYRSLKEQLKDFGGGFDISLLAAIPKGSGLGTSSILAATLLGALSDYCGLESDHATIGQKTLILEQMLTTGGGWQDQYGGILPGVKLIGTSPGFAQVPEIRWLPEFLFRNEESKSCMLLYYTGVTRVAKNILGEIVRRMFLNHNETLSLIREIVSNAIHISEAVNKGSWEEFNRCVETSWKLNKMLDTGTNPPPVQQILDPLDDLLLSKKLLGAGGGGYLLMIAKDPDAALRVKTRLTSGPDNPGARFIDFKLSGEGLSVTRS